MEGNLIFLLAPDSFKESMTAKEVCHAIEEGVSRSACNIEFISIPIADGGEGTTESLIYSTNGKIYYENVLDPLGDIVKAYYGILGDGRTAVIEVASASGLHLVSEESRNPLLTDSYGTGQLIKAALDKGASKLIIGLGGSATNDAGVGMFAALGGEFYTANGVLNKYGGGQLGNITHIDLENLDPRLYEVEIEIASDVQNPLYGPNGATHFFGPQKGATIEIREELENNIKHYSYVLSNALGKDVSNEPGSGAAGGIGASLLSIVKGKMRSGIELVINYSNLEEQVKKADIVWTGEGCIDPQTKYGKAILGITRLAAKYNKPVIVLAGRVKGNVDFLYNEGVTSIFSISDGETNLSEMLKNGKINISRTSENLIKLFKLKELCEAQELNSYK